MAVMAAAGVEARTMTGEVAAARRMAADVAGAVTGTMTEIGAEGGDTTIAATTDDRADTTTGDRGAATKTDAAAVVVAVEGVLPAVDILRPCLQTGSPQRACRL